jgi:hypothetical protein
MNSFTRFHGSPQWRKWMEEYKGWTTGAIIRSAAGSGSHQSLGVLISSGGGDGSGDEHEGSVASGVGGSRYDSPKHSAVGHAFRVTPVQSNDH